MDKIKIERINELAHKKKSVGLTEEEAKEPLYCFTADDGVEHCVWKIASTENNEKLQAAFSMMDKICSLIIKDYMMLVLDANGY